MGGGGGGGVREKGVSGNSLEAIAVRAGIRTAQVEDESRNFPFVPATQASGLYVTNVAGGENDAQLRRALAPGDVTSICADAAVLEAGRAGDAPR